MFFTFTPNGGDQQVAVHAPHLVSIKGTRSSSGEDRTYVVTTQGQYEIAAPVADVVKDFKAQAARFNAPPAASKGGGTTTTPEKPEGKQS